MFNAIWQGLSRLVYPPHCLLCKKYITQKGSPSHYLFGKGLTQKGSPSQYLLEKGLSAPWPVPLVCPPCQQHIVPNRPPFCVRCSRPLTKICRHSRCQECRRHNHQFDFAWSACLYEDHLKKLIHLFKYGQKTGLRHILSDLMITFIRQYNLDIAQFDFIIPVPLSPTRLRERGYNQSGLLATEISKTFAIEVSTNQIKRARHTKAQALLDTKQRWTNIQDAFRIVPSNTVRDKNILLIDDLLTTGATASEAARVLKDAGAGTVGVLTLAITTERN